MNEGGVSILLIIMIIAFSLGTLGWLVAFFGRLKNYRLIANTPTSKIASAVSGYTELKGTAELIAGSQIVSPLGHQPCVWYEYSVYNAKLVSKEGRTQTEWNKVEEGSSQTRFQLRDDSDVCIVNPKDAEIICDDSVTWYGATQHPSVELYSAENNPFLTYQRNRDHYRYIEKIIPLGSDLYALGWLTVKEVKQKTAENSNLQKSEQVIENAKYELKNPPKSQPFILSTKSEHNLCKHYLWQTIGTLFGFIVFFLATGFMIAIMVKAVSFD